jgi:hypothetical protein
MMIESPIVRVTNPDGQPIAVNATVTLDTAVTAPHAFNVAVTNSESPLVLPPNTKRFLVRPKAAKMQVAFQAGGPYVTIANGSVYEESDIKRASTTLYLVSSIANDIADVIAWQ